MSSKSVNLPASRCNGQPRGSPNPVLLVFFGESIHNHDGLNLRPLVFDPTSTPSPVPRDQGDHNESSSPPIFTVGSPENQSPLSFI